MMDRTSVISYISRLVSEAHPNPITGGQLAARVKVSFPDLNFNQFGYKNLREFITKQIPNITERGQAGMDVLYGLPMAQQVELFEPYASERSPATDPRAPLGQLLTNPRIWKTFASPDSPYRLFMIPSGAIRVLRPSDSPESSWRAVPPISADALLRIAKNFISELPQSEQEILSRTLEQPRWWIPYFELVNTLGLRMRWISFRRRRIVEEFERALSLASPTIASAPLVQHPDPRAVALESQPDSHVRRIATFAIQHMTDTELRALNLPLGYVIDALTGNK